MTLKPRFFVILAVIIAVIAYYGWKHSGGKLPAGFPFAKTTTTAGAPGASPGEAANLTSDQAASGDILVSTTGTKQKWLQAEIDKFNAQSQAKATLDVRESRTAMHDILDGKLQPSVWSPSSPVWVTRLSQVFPQENHGKLAVDMGDPDAYRVIFRSPLVFLTTREKAKFLTPILAGGAPFTQLADYASGQKRAPWGGLRFSYADPLNASSGTLTMSLIISEYARQHNNMDPDTAVQSAGFSAFLRKLDQGLVRDDTQGSSALEKAYTSNPASRDFITAYESAALAAVTSNPDLVMIYPNPTDVADQGVAVMSGPWTTSAQQATSEKFVKFLAAGDSVTDGIQYYFRPAIGDAGEFEQRLEEPAHDQYRESYTSVELVPYDALNDAAGIYNSQKG